MLLARSNRILNEENAVALGKILENVESFTGALAAQGDQIEALIADASRTMENLRDASSAAESFAENLDKSTPALIEEAEATLAEVRELADTLGGASVGVEQNFDVLAADMDLTGPRGQHILRHEIAHVLQQTGERPLSEAHDARPIAGRPGRGLVADAAREAAADQGEPLCWDTFNLARRQVFVREKIREELGRRP